MKWGDNMSDNTDNKKMQGDTLNIMQDAFEAYLNEKCDNYLIFGESYGAGTTLKRINPIKFMQDLIEWITKDKATT